jgi:site-specific DNA-methyltransferase (adenine-specific)
MGTVTQAFGAGRRESHDSSGFYSRFTAPVISKDATVAAHAQRDRIFLGDAAAMTEQQVAENSVALVVTSPPYFVGKDYEADMGQGHVPATYLEYLDGLRDVFEACARALEPGGRMAINVANLGRKPYRSLAADIISILQDDLGLLLRGEIIWQKARGAGGSCAWGSFQSPANPVLRDLTERVIIASKGRFDRALTRKQRAQRGLPSEVSVSVDDFLDATTDVWEIPSESAKRVGHPAPFPVELPQRLIHLYTYKGDLVLDPFMGSGTTGVAAVRTDRYFVGFDIDESYLKKATRRIDKEKLRLSDRDQMRLPGVSLPALGIEDTAADPFESALRAGLKASEVARAMLEEAGFLLTGEKKKLLPGVEVTFEAEDRNGTLWYFDVTGGFTTQRSGLSRTDAFWRALGKAAAVRSVTQAPLVLLAPDLPPSTGPLATTLDAVRGTVITDALGLLDAETRTTLESYAAGR